MRSVKTINKNFNIPNLLSCIRIVLVPFYTYYYLKDRVTISIVLITLSGLSDCFDGFIARKFNQITEIGKMLDPLADKITQVAVALCIAVKHPEISPFLYVFLAKEVGMLVCGVFLLSKHKKTPGASKWYGKVATILFYVSCSIIILMTLMGINGSTFKLVANILLALTAVMMIYSAIGYGRFYLKLLTKGNTENQIDLQGEMKAQRELNSRTRKR